VRTIGILGGGQLGRMLALEAKRMGYRVATLEPLPDSPAGQVADEQLVASYDDLRAIGELGARSDVVTFEFENIPLGSVRALEDDGRLVRPGSEVLRISQDRALEKAFLQSIGAPVAPVLAVDDPRDLMAAVARIGYPAVVKTALGGYDGKGQWVAGNDDETRACAAEAAGRRLVVEQKVAFDCEASMICARSVAGDVVAYPIGENVHDRGILAMTIVPGRVPPRAAVRAREFATRVGERLGIVGTYAVEFFVCGDEVLVNEIAPRVHNSGHYTLDASPLSQYEAHVRAICDLPLVEPELLRAAVMTNILGTGEGDGLRGIEELLRIPSVRLHLYGKRHAAARRKMGHFTALAPTTDEALAKAERAKAALHWAPEGTHVPVTRLGLG